MHTISSQNRIIRNNYLLLNNCEACFEFAKNAVYKIPKITSNLLRFGVQLYADPGSIFAKETLADARSHRKYKAKVAASLAYNIRRRGSRGYFPFFFVVDQSLQWRPPRSLMMGEWRFAYLQMARNVCFFRVEVFHGKIERFNFVEFFAEFFRACKLVRRESRKFLSLGKLKRWHIHISSYITFVLFHT